MFSRIIAIAMVSLMALGMRGGNCRAFLSRSAPKQSLIARNFWPFDKAADPTGVAIIDAVQSQSDDKVKFLLSRGEAINSIVNEIEPATGNNAMHIIAKKGHYKFPPANIPKMLVEAGIDINAKNGKGETPLEISLLSGWQVLNRHTILRQHM